MKYTFTAILQFIIVWCYGQDTIRINDSMYKIVSTKKEAIPDSLVKEEEPTIGEPSTKSSNIQIIIKIETDFIYVGDTLKMYLFNSSKTKAGFYCIRLQIFEKKRWAFMKPDILNDNARLNEKWNKISPIQKVDKYFLIDSIFTGAFRRYKQLPSRLVLIYSYSSELEPRLMTYSKKFIVKAKY